VHALQVHLCADEVVTITVDPRTGRLNLRDTGDLAAAGRGPRFAVISEKLNENPTALPNALVYLRLIVSHCWICGQGFGVTNHSGRRLQISLSKRRVILDCKVSASATSQAKVRLPPFRFPRLLNMITELAKLGSSTRGTLYIQLSNFPGHYLVLVITDEQFRYALITTRVVSDSMFSHMVMEDIAWLDFDRIHGEGLVISAVPSYADISMGKRKQGNGDTVACDPVAGVRDSR